MKRLPNAAATLTLSAAALLAACGGGSGNNEIATSASPESTSSELATITKANTSANSSASAELVSTKVHSTDAFVNSTRKVSESGTIVKSVAIAPRSTTPDGQTIDLGALPASELDKVHRYNERKNSPSSAKRHQIGVGRSIGATDQAKKFQQVLVWSQKSNANAEGLAKFTSADAYGIRLGLKVEALPDSALVRVSSAGAEKALELKGASINQAIAANVKADGENEAARTYWLPLTVGSSTELTIELPAGVDTSSVLVSVPSLIHALESAPQASLKAASEKSACPSINPDPVCNTPLPPAANAVVSYDFVSEGTNYVCTGTLLSDKGATGTPYFLTANHCVDSQTVASSMENYWFYRSSACNSNTINPGVVLTGGGATLLMTRSDITTNTRNPIGTDTSFMFLNAPAPAGAVFAGWTTARQAISNSVNLTGLHNPLGDFLRQSTGVISNMGVYMPNNNLISTADTTQPMYQTSWSAGITEGGSSGSALFLNGTTANPQVVGQLWGGYSSCSAPTAPDFYGRFDLAYQNGLISWLNPGFKMVFRFYRPNNGTHFFSADVGERDQVRATNLALNYEGPVYSVKPQAAAGLSPVYRFLNKATGSHFYTIDEAERAAVQANTALFTLEGVAWYARKANAPVAGTIEVYRFFRKSAGTHLYTTSVAERDNIIATLGQFYNYEGVAYLAWPAS